MNTLTDLLGIYNHHSRTVCAFTTRFATVCFLIITLLIGGKAQVSAFSARHIAGAEQTDKPKVTVNADGSISVEKHESGDADTRFYYTTDGSTPTTESSSCTSIIPASETDGKIIKVIAASGGKTPSDIVTAYVNVRGSFKWAWNTSGPLQSDPTIDGNHIADVIDASTKAVIGKKLSAGVYNKNGITAVSFKPADNNNVVNDIDEESSIAFNIIPKAGISFRPTGISFKTVALSTGSGLMDVKLISESNNYPLIQSVLPSRDKMQEFSDKDFKTKIAEIPGAAEEWALKCYIYTLANKKEWGFNDIIISGTFSGVEYEGQYYNISATAEPTDGGKVSHSPAALHIVAGKRVTLTASPMTGYKFVKWRDYETGNDMGDNRVIHIEKLDKDLSCEAVFEKLPHISFDKGKIEIDGSVPQKVYTDDDGSIIIPQNTTLFKEDYALTGWTDGSKVYPLGTKQFFSQDVTLTPVVTLSEKQITDTDIPVTATWNFDQREKAPIISGTFTPKKDGTFTYTKSVCVGKDNMIDLPLLFSGAKADNNDARVNYLKDRDGNEARGAQFNNNLILRIPAVYGMNVEIKASGKVDKEDPNGINETFFSQPKDGNNVNKLAEIGFYENSDTTTKAKGYAKTDENNPKLMSFSYSGDAEYLYIKVINGGSTKTYGFFEYLKVTYPALPDVLLENKITSEPLKDRNEDPDKASLALEKSSPMAGTNTGKRYKEGDKVTITAEAGYGYEIHAFKAGNNVLVMKKNEVKDEAGNVVATEYNAEYTVGKETSTVTVEYERKPMSKVRVVTADKSLGNVDFVADDIHDNFYLKGDGFVESYFVAGEPGIMASTDAKDNYVIDRWTKDSKDGNEVSSSAIFSSTAPAENDSVTYYAHFTLGIEGSVRFRLKDKDGKWLCKLFKGKAADGTNVYDSEALTLDEKSIAPDDQENCRSFFVPKYYTIFKTYDAASIEKGYTLKYWVNKDDISDEYEIGKNYSFTKDKKDITLIPVFEQNPAGMMYRTNEPVITYEFGTARGIRAQRLNIPNGKDFYYSGKVDVHIMENGANLDHTRDVALWINTGKKGFVRNTDFEKWAAIGPGTTLTIASCADTRFEICTYAPISSTTIDGVVPTDCVKTADGYVYSYTTHSSASRIPIVIGDDYSYYKWIKAYTRKAARVDLRATVDNDEQGVITAIDATNKNKEDNIENPPIIPLEDGGVSMIQGNGAIISFQRKFGYEFDKIVDMDKIVNGKPLAVLKIRDDGNVDMVNFNNATTTSVVATNADGNSWGHRTGESKTTFELRRIEPTDKEAKAGKRTRYEVEFDITSHRNLRFYFKEKPTYYVTFNPGKQASGIAPTALWVEKGDEFTIPKNTTLYYSGHTLKYWKDNLYDDSKSFSENVLAGHVYEFGKSYSLTHNWAGSDETPDYSLRLYPVFEKNSFTRFDEDMTNPDGYKATWDFRRSNGAPSIAVERTTGILVTQLYKNKDKFIDIKIDLDATNGKFNNTSDDSRCQINNGSILTFSVTNGSKIELEAVNKISSTVIAGATNANGGYTAGNKVSTVWTGSEGKQTINFQSDGRYYTIFSVTYMPQTLSRPQLESVSIGGTSLKADEINNLKANRNITIKTCPISLDANGEEVRDANGFVVEKIGDVSATSIDGQGIIEVTQPTIDNPQAIIRLLSKGGSLLETYTIDFTLTAPEGKSPQFLYYNVNGTKYFSKEISINDMPPSGYVKMVFDRTMKSISFNMSEIRDEMESWTASQGKELTFYYWDLANIKDITVPIKKGEFEDIYGNKYNEVLTTTQDGTELSFLMNFSTRSFSHEILHDTFDFIVGKDGSLEDAINAANANSGTDRYYIFVPDGDYELKGNEPLTKYGKDSDGNWPRNDKGEPVMDMLGKTNGRTLISRSNISLIGQSRNGVRIWNKPIVEGISYTATLHIGKNAKGTNAKDFYCEDLSLENTYNYWGANGGGSAAGRAVAFWDQGQRTTLKNVSMMSWQDTYYSTNSISDYRGYLEDCRIGGVVDCVCGDGNIWFERCDLVLRDRAGNNFSAPSHPADQQWGYVFSNCNFVPEYPLSQMNKLEDKTWTLARPWANEASKSPAITFLNTTMYVLPKDQGWGAMSANAVLRFHENRSLKPSSTGDGLSTVLSLGGRSLAACNPAVGSDDCVLSDGDAAKYSIKNVLGGLDGYDPVERTMQIDAVSGNDADKDIYNSDPWDDNIEIDDDRLQWNSHPYALCYFIFKKENGKWIYKTQVAQANDSDAITSISLDQLTLGIGTYCVRAANQYGGLGAATKAINYVEAQRYTLTINPLGSLTDDEGRPCGWSTICLPYNAKATTEEGVIVYAVTAHGKTTAEDKVEDFYVTLTPVDVLNKDKGYVVFGPAADYVFKATSRSSTTPTILKGNSSDRPVSAINNDCYVLANKNFGLGFYKFTGSELKPYKAWLPAEMVNTNVGEQIISGAKGIRFLFSDSSDLPTGIHSILYGSSTASSHSPSPVFTVSGQRIGNTTKKGTSALQRGIYIIGGKGKRVEGR